MSDAILRGVRVLDFGRFVAGPYAAAILGDLGADVIRVEPPAGGEDRFKMPLGEDAPGANFVQMGRSKRSLTLDIGTEAGREVLNRLLAGSDVLIVNAPPRTVRAMGLDYETVSAIKPDIVMAMGTAYGLGGPYSDRLGFDAIGQALSGAVHLTGEPDMPMRAQAAYCDYGTALYLTVGILAALMERQASGKGQLLESSLLHSGLAFMSHFLAEQAVLKTDRPRTGNRGQTSGPIDLFKARDGWFFVFVLGDPQFRRLARLIGRPEWLEDPRFADDNLRGANSEELSEGVAQWCAGRSCAECLELLEQARVPAGEMLSPQGALDDPHIRAMNFIRPMPAEGLAGPVPVVDLPLRMSRSRAGIRAPAPRLGEHSSEILASLGYGPEEVEKLRAAGVV